MSEGQPRPRLQFLYGICTLVISSQSTYVVCQYRFPPYLCECPALQMKHVSLCSSHFSWLQPTNSQVHYCMLYPATFLKHTMTTTDQPRLAPMLDDTMAKFRKSLSRLICSAVVPSLRRLVPPMLLPTLPPIPQYSSCFPAQDNDYCA